MTRPPTEIGDAVSWIDANGAEATGVVVAVDDAPGALWSGSTARALTVQRGPRHTAILADDARLTVVKPTREAR